MTRVLFVNAGILGLASFHRFLLEELPRQSSIAGEHILLTQHLTLAERLIRRALCQRLWVDGTFGLTNIDAARFRAELNAGLLARRRITDINPDRFDVLHFHRQATAYASLDLMRRIPSIVSIDCTQDCVISEATTAIERMSYGLNARLDGAVFRRAAAIIATSHWAVETMRRRYPDCDTPVHVMPNPVLLHYFDRGWLQIRRQRSRPRPRLLFMGGDFPRKGGFDLLAAWEAGRLHERADLALVTNWDVPGALPAGVVVTRGVQPHSHEWQACWRDADAFVMPTRNEAFGLVYQEAAAAGLPAIGTRHNAVPEIILDGETGLLVPVGDRAALARAMAALIDSPELRDRLGSRARAEVEKVACPRDCMERLSSIAAEAAARGGRAGGSILRRDHARKVDAVPRRTTGDVS